jgi:putative ATPase
MTDLFESRESLAPLAERMRPRTLDEVVGQEHLIGAGGVLRRAVEAAELPSMILWGPPGSGKTTLARLLAAVPGYRFASFSAVLAGVKDVRSVAELAAKERKLRGLRTLLFIDEVHRFNKAQQDALLPHVEAGTVVLVGATTENPSFEVNSALLSRCHVFVLKRLEPEHLHTLAERVLSDREHGLGSSGLAVEAEALDRLVTLADGDARQLYNALETLASLVPPDEAGARIAKLDDLRKLKGRIFLAADRAGEEHFNLISALHKSVRGSDPDASLYWLARMLEGGDDPLFVARRVVRMAIEDIGLADPVALMVANAAKDAIHFMGLPEGALALAEAVVYMALAPKSNSIYKAYGKACESAQETGSLPVPIHLRNAPTRLMKELGFGRDYIYPQDAPGRWIEEKYFPDEMRARHFYRASDQGREAKLWAGHIERIRIARRLQGQERPAGERATPERKPPGAPASEAPPEAP